METLCAGVEAAARAAGIDPGQRRRSPRSGAFCLAGADLPVDDRRILPALRAAGMADQVLLRNDTFAVLRAGTDRGWGVGRGVRHRPQLRRASGRTVAPFASRRWERSRETASAAAGTSRSRRSARPSGPATVVGRAPSSSG